mmetsp:Transcript_24176/g.38724  ORF Transcript_24176/g.38724 Transcript_24176/m.38724 type:complete len:86 (+) Transcript_24176:99-356(+)
MTSPDLPAIVSVLPGSLMDKWNATCTKQTMVAARDCLVSVNGVRGNSEELVDQLRRTGSFKLKVKKPHEYNISVQNRLAKTLGFG